MAVACRNPECEHEFDPSVMHDVVEARDEGEVPYFTRVHDPDDEIGVRTAYYCSFDCLAAVFGGAE